MQEYISIFHHYFSQSDQHICAVICIKVENFIYTDNVENSATGIYFQTNLDIAGAISKYNIDTQNGRIQIKTNKEAICTIYDDLYDFANNEPSFEPHIQKLQILTKLFHLSKPYDYNFVITTNKKQLLLQMTAIF